jgi:hypothetical protein
MATRPHGDGGVPPPSEQVHLPGESYLPVTVALGTTLSLVGVFLSWFVFGLGAAIVVVALVIWIRETREEIAELPLER